MQKNSTQPPLKKERAQTDNSLNVERGKTDESFDAYKGATESKMDKAVIANRLEADNARTQRRSELDGNQDVPGSSDAQLQRNRESEDIAIDLERSKNDLALERERGEKERLLSKLVSIERQTTDKNLLFERTKTDLETKLAANLLTAEKTAHLDTKSALTTREEFVAIVSHDLRNPIGAILSASNIIMDDPSVDGIGDDAKRCLQMIRRNADTALRLISDILDMERIVEGKLHLQLAPHKTSVLVSEAIESCAHVAAAKKITLNSKFTMDDSFINCDRDRIAQILSNLIGNALKFTPEGGSITVATEESSVEIKVSISDTGPGIPENQKNHIFERFAQIGNKNRTGLGLGLYISKTLVESHGGKIWVTSAVGKGSTFYFTLPKP